MDNNGQSSEKMSKDGARTYILNLLEAGNSPEQISESLCYLLNAPISLVERFVAQVSQEHSEIVRTKINAAQASPSSEIVQNPMPGDDRLRQSAAEKGIKTTSSGVIIPAKPDDVSSGISKLMEDPHPDTVAAFFLSGSTETKSIPEGQHSDLYAPINTDPRELTPAEQNEVEEYILRELGRQRKQNDVIIGVCQMTGLHWRHAQKLVAKVMAHNQKKLITNQNMIIIPLALIAVLVGVILVIASVNEMLVFRNLLIDPNSVTPEQVNYLSETGREIIWAFGIGAILGLGGIIGMFMAIKKQLSVD